VKELRFDVKSGKWLGIVNGKCIARSTSKYYVQRCIDGQSPNKGPIATPKYAVNPDIAEVSDITTPKVEEFGINQRFGFVEQMITMVCKKTLPSAVITGDGGLGKSYTVIKALTDNDYADLTDLAGFEIGTKLNLSKAYRVVKGYSTAKGLYRTLFECNNMCIVFDDCDSILKDPVALNILKGALDSYSKRYISWNAEMRDDDLPKCFEFTGQVIFISNMKLDRIDQAVRTRALCVDLAMTQLQKVERMEVIALSDEFLPEVSDIAKSQALQFIKDNINSVGNLSLRTLIAVAKIADSNSNWKDLAKYAITQGA